MKTNALLILLAAAALASGSAYAQQPNPVISGSQGTSPTPSGSGTQPSTGGRITSAVENFIGRFLGNEQSQNLDQLPQAAQSTVRNMIGTAPIQSIRQVNQNGQTTYVVAYNQNGQTQNLQVDSLGRVMPGGAPNGVIGATPNPPNNVIGRAPVPVPSVPDWRTAPPRQPLVNTTPVAFASLPQSVRQTLLNYAADGAVDNIQMGMLGGQTIYEAQLHPNGQTIALRLSDAGALINDQVNDQFLTQVNGPQNRAVGIGQAPGWRGASSSAYGMAPLSSTTAVDFNQLPLGVQTTLNAQASGAPISSVAQGSLDGRTVYDATYNQGGQWVTMRVADDGSVLGSRAAAR